MFKDHRWGIEIKHFVVTIIIGFISLVIILFSSSKQNNEKQNKTKILHLLYYDGSEEVISITYSDTIIKHYPYSTCRWGDEVYFSIKIDSKTRFRMVEEIKILDDE
jgi:hypothetical protein